MSIYFKYFIFLLKTIFVVCIDAGLSSATNCFFNDYDIVPIKKMKKFAPIQKTGRVMWNTEILKSPTSQKNQGL